MLIKSFIYAIVGATAFLSAAKAQYNDISGNNPYIQQYLEEDEENWNKSIIYVFYNNGSCHSCAAAMRD